MTSCINIYKEIIFSRTDEEVSYKMRLLTS